MRQNQTGFFYMRRRAVGLSLVFHAALILALLVSPPVKNMAGLDTIFVSILASSPKSDSGETRSSSIAAGPRHMASSPVKKISAKRPEPPLMEEVVAEKQISYSVANEVQPVLQTSVNEAPGVSGDVNLAGDAASESPGGVQQYAQSGEGRGGAEGMRHTGETKFGEAGAPFFVYQAMPAYPAQARRLGMEGRVVLKLLIDANGKLVNIEVVESAGYGFTEASIEAVRKSTYAPGVRNGVKVATRALLPISFRLQ